jgi:poly-gamma-glutamate synthesis protein (capsule biosynthesis protein)
VEKATAPDPQQVSFAHGVIDAGADVIVGHHPHVLQGVERYRSGIIAYSMGNFLFGGNSRSSYDTALLELRVQGDSISYNILPLRVDDWSARLLTGTEGLALVNHVKQLPIPLHPHPQNERSGQ